jgi:hypothetical protein
MFPTAESTTLAAPLDPALIAEFSRAPAGQQVHAFVYFKDQVDVKSVAGSNRSEKSRNVLCDKADGTQTDLRSLMQIRRAEGLVITFTPLWIVNAIAVTASRSVIDEIAREPGVDHIGLDTTLHAPVAPARYAVSKPAAQATVEPNVSLIHLTSTPSRRQTYPVTVRGPWESWLEGAVWESPRTPSGSRPKFSLMMEQQLTVLFTRGFSD